MELIDKTVVLAEIERQLHYVNSWLEGHKRVDDRRSNVYFRMIGNKNVLEDIKDFLYTIDSIKTKDVDLEKEIDSLWNPRFNLGWDENSLLSINHEGFSHIARHFFELGLKAREECIKNIPLLSWQTPCADPNYPCENPQMDCINCPRHPFNRYETAYQKFLYQGNPTKENNWINQLYKEKEDK